MHEVSVDEQASFTPQEAFPNLIHRVIYYGLASRNLWAADRQARKEAKTLESLDFDPSITKDKDYKIEIRSGHWRRRAELVQQGHAVVERFMLDHSLGTPEFQEAVEGTQTTS